MFNPKMSRELAAARSLFEKVIAAANDELVSGVLLSASYPRSGEEARIEIAARRDTLLWVLENMPEASERGERGGVKKRRATA